MTGAASAAGTARSRSSTWPRRSARPSGSSCGRSGGSDTDVPWRAVIRAPEVGTEMGPPPSRTLRERVRIVPAAEISAADALATADVVVAASSGVAASAQLPLRAMAAGAIPVAARLPQYEEALGFGDRGLLFEPRDAETLAAQLRRLVEDEDLRSRLAAEVERAAPELSWSRVADDMEELYAEVAARRHSTGNPSVRRRLSSRPLVDVDLHMHTDHSPDCATPVDVLLDTAKARGLDAIAITDHNEVSGALEARDRADGIKVIVAEEVKTAEQGEVIGLFIEEKIPRGLTLEETIAEIHRQGGLAYVPHPFDRMHSVPDYEHLLPVVDEIDAIEVFNPRVAFTSFNEEAERFAAKYRIAGGAGSDSHVAQGLGSVKISMRDFDGPEEFLESLRERGHRAPPPVAPLRPGAQVPPDQGPSRARHRPGAHRRCRRRRGRREQLLMHARGQTGVPCKTTPACAPPTTRSGRSTSSGPFASSTD
ncbi:MAG: PHP domain-containing protein [Thermoleophilaceae bacterium]